MTDLLAEIQQAENQIQESKEIHESQIDLAVPKPDERQINALLLNMEDSHTPDRLRKEIEMNVNTIPLDDFWKWWGVVESYRITSDPRRQSASFWAGQNPIGLKTFI
jgi:hypothetical protein